MRFLGKLNGLLSHLNDTIYPKKKKNQEEEEYEGKPFEKAEAHVTYKRRLDKQQGFDYSH
jgi:hypothetical protein